MEGILITLRLVTYDKYRLSELVKRLYGQQTSSHGGTNVDRRKGPLDEIPHVRLIRGEVIARGRYQLKIPSLLHAF